MSASAGKPGDRPARGLLKPGLKWPAPGDAKIQALKKAGLGSNSVTQTQFSLEQLKKLAASRGLSLEKLVAQMVEQYLKEASGDKDQA
jgi:hypothetical protein